MRGLRVLTTTKKKGSVEQNYTQETAKHISAILEQTPNGVLLVDKETRIHYVTPSFR